MVYVLALPWGFFSARSFTVWSPVITQSGSFPCSLRALAGSSLVTLTIFQVVASHVSVTCAKTRTFTHLSLGGQSTFGSAATLVITGGVVSTTLMTVPHEAVLPPESLTVTPT